MHDQRNMDKNFNGFVEVCVHQARNIHNICIYQNQDVYAKIFSTDEPERKISTKVINGGGKNPVFNETLRVDVPTVDSSLRCEVWMLSRIKNYLEDQLLGFVLLPLSDVVSESGRPPREFELSSSELFHSPAGFVELSFNCTGKSPEELMEMTKPLSSEANNSNICCELDKIEFPDQEIVKENERMVSEYLRYPCEEEVESENDVKTDDDDSQEKADGDGGESAVPTTTLVSPSKDTAPSSIPVSSTAQTPLINVGVEKEEKVVEEEIVDMYMRGMQQFTDALAKMKLPMDHVSSAETNSSNLREESGCDGKAKSGDPTPKVFYGSRAFF